VSATVDNTLHAAAGFGIAAATLVPAVWLWWWPALAVPCLLAGLGLFREQAQHRGEGWFGWWNGKRALEAFTWGIGAVLAAGVWLVLSLVVR